MKPAESLPESHSSSKDAPAEPGPRTSEVKELRDFEPKYLEVPWQKRRPSGGRNLVVGLLLLIAAIATLGQAFVLSGSRVLIPVAAALLAVLVLFVLARARILRQRNGGFLGLAVVCLLAALIPFLENAFNRFAPSASGAAKAVPADNRPSEPSSGHTGTQLPQLTQVYQIPSPAESAPRFKILRDLKVEMDGKVYLIKAGEVFAASESNDEEVRFNAGDQQIALGKNLVEMIAANSAPVVAPSANQVQATGQGAVAGANLAVAAKDSPANGAAPVPSKPEGPKSITEEAQREAIRRYPALGQKNSPENQLFVETYQELKHTGATDFFADPEWPLQLAELLARRERWKRAGQQQAAEPEPQQEEAPSGLDESKDKPMQDEPTAEQPTEQPTAELPQDPLEDLPTKR